MPALGINTGHWKSCEVGMSCGQGGVEAEQSVGEGIMGWSDIWAYGVHKSVGKGEVIGCRNGWNGAWILDTGSHSHTQCLLPLRTPYSTLTHTQCSHPIPPLSTILSTLNDCTLNNTQSPCTLIHTECPRPILPWPAQNACIWCLHPCLHPMITPHSTLPHTLRETEILD